MFQLIFKLILAVLVASSPHCDYGTNGDTFNYSTCQNNALIAYQNTINSYQTQYQNNAAAYAEQTNWAPNSALAFISLTQGYAWQMQQLMNTANQQLQAQLAAC